MKRKPQRSLFDAEPLAPCVIVFTPIPEQPFPWWAMNWHRRYNRHARRMGLAVK